MPGTDDERFRLDGRVALITGGGSGIGLGIAQVFAAAGAAVVLTGRREAPLREAVVGLRETGARALAVPANVRDADQIAAVVRRAEAELGAVDILVNNAGGAFSDDYRHGALLDVEPESFGLALQTNLVGPHLVSRAVVPGMLERGRGAVLNIASVAGRQGALPFPGLGFHNAGKAGLIRLTSVMASEWAPAVRVNAIAPGFVATTRLLDGLEPEHLAASVSRTALGRAGAPEDIGLAALFLVSDASDWITGVTLDVDGGMLGAGPGAVARAA